MEKLISEKFASLSANEMNEIHGGKWGWAVEKVLCFGDGRTEVLSQRYNIWGNPTGDWDHIND